MSETHTRTGPAKKVMTGFPYFKYRDDTLFCEDVNLQDLAQKEGTPLYVYSYQSLVDQQQKLAQAFSKANPLLCFAVKANTNGAILKIFFDLGCGADVVSGGELQRALKAGCASQKIVFSGVGKTVAEIELALAKKIYQFNVESEAELELIQKIAHEKKQKAVISIRVNPDVDAKTHPYISTGLQKNKFGVDHSLAVPLFQKAAKMSAIKIQGIACHIGSQLIDIKPFADAAQKICNLVLELKKQGITLKTIDMGGGVGIRYQDENEIDPQKYSHAIWSPLKDLGCKLILEPGRFLCGNAGIFMTKVLYTKKNSAGRIFTIVDGAFNDLKRPALYDAYHEIVPLQKNTNRKPITTDVVGPICETTDTFAKDRKILEAHSQEFLALMSCGAYGSSMASTYNSRPKSKEVLIKGDQIFVVRKPDTIADLTQNEIIPHF